MYKPKICKREKPASDLCIIHYGQPPLAGETINPEYTQIVSVDPATDNYAIRVERRWQSGLVETVAQNKAKFSKLVEESRSSLYSSLERFLQQYETFTRQADLFVVEKQLAINYQAVRISQHTISHFIRLAMEGGSNKQCVVEVDSKLKTKMLHPNAGRKMNETDTKAWSAWLARELSLLREDDFFLRIHSSLKKKDDISDTLVQIEALLSFWQSLEETELAFCRQLSHIPPP